MSNLDLAIHATTSDIYFDDVGELAVVRDADAVAQEVQTVLRHWKGEWFLDTSAGVPYLEDILKKGVSEASVRAILVREIESVPDVVRVRSMDVTLDRATRHATVTALEVDTVYGVAELTDVLVGGAV